MSTWGITCDRYVAFCDIMGFKSLVQEHEGDYSGLHARLAKLHDTTSQAVALAEQTWPTATYAGHLRAVQFSDSIVLMTKDASSVASLLITLGSMLIFRQALEYGLPLRGAIAVGRATADFERSILFGQPIIDAYLLAEDQQWYGVVQHPDMDVLPPEDDQGDLQELGDDEMPLTETFQVPLKVKGCQPETRSLQVVNWPIIVDTLGELHELLGRLKPSDSHPEREKLTPYYESTLEFATTTWNKYRGPRA
jgi:hypothetical protein